MGFSDAFAHSRRAGQDADPELLATCERLAAAGWEDLIPEMVRMAAPGAAQHRRAAAVANAFLAADQLVRAQCVPVEPELARARTAALLVLFGYCFDELAIWMALVLERSPRRQAEPIGSKKLNARLRMLDAGAAGRVSDLTDWVSTVRSVTTALMQQPQATLRIDDGWEWLQPPSGAGHQNRGGRPLAELGPEWIANLAGLLQGVFACGAARLASPRERIGEGFDWD